LLSHWFEKNEKASSKVSDYDAHSSDGAAIRKDVQAMLGRFPWAGDVSSAAGSIDVDAREPTEPEMTDAQIVRSVPHDVDPGEKEEKSQSSDEEPDVPPSSLRDARQATDVLLRYLNLRRTHDSRRHEQSIGHRESAD
jgi:hypothetical protein